MAKRKIMRAFKIDELSAVDRPAQEGAQMVLMKRKHPVKDDDKKKPGKDDKKPGKDDKDDDKKKKPAFMTKLALLTDDHPDGHSHLILGSGDIAGFTSFGGASNENGHQHPWVKMLSGDVLIGASHGHEHGIREEVTKMILSADQIEHLFSYDPDEAKAAALEKRAFAESGIAMEDGSLPLEKAEDIETVLNCQEFWGDNPEAIRHIMKRATVLEVELPDTGELATMFKTEQLAIEDDLSKENKTMTTKNVNVAKDEGFEKQLEDAATKQAATEAELAVSKQLAEMTDAQKSHYTDLDLEAATEFLAKSADEKDEEIAAVKDADKVIFKSADGTEYRKSDDPRLVTMAKREEKRDVKMAKMEKDAGDKTYAKRAQDELPHLSGTEESKIATLKAIDGIEDEDVRKTSLEALHAQNTEMATAFESHGTTSSPASASAEVELDNLAKKYAEDNKVEYGKAYSAVCRTAKGNELYNQSTQH